MLTLLTDRFYSELEQGWQILAIECASSCWSRRRVGRRWWRRGRLQCRQYRNLLAAVWHGLLPSFAPRITLRTFIRERVVGSTQFKTNRWKSFTQTEPLNRKYLLAIYPSIMAPHKKKKTTGATFQIIFIRVPITSRILQSVANQCDCYWSFRMAWLEVVSYCISQAPAVQMIRFGWKGGF